MKVSYLIASAMLLVLSVAGAWAWYDVKLVTLFLAFAWAHNLEKHTGFK
jgi:hypothetical protein